jgi:DNA-binding Lrp family transcriptional regulator
MPPIDFLDIRILALLDEQLFHSASLIAEALCASHSTILSRLRESLGMKISIEVGSRTS